MPAKPRRNLSNSLYRPEPKEGPGGQQRLFPAPKTPWASRAETERVPPPRESWEDMSPKRQAAVTEHLASHGVTAEGAQQRFIDSYGRAKQRAGGGTPQGQGSYATEQPQRFEEDAKHFGVPYHVVVAANAITSPKQRLVTSTGLQLNRESAHKILHHVLSGKPGVPTETGLGPKTNVRKATEMVRQHLQGIHPLDATDPERPGKKLLSGPKVEEYYASHMRPDPTTSDVWHGRLAFGPTVRGDLLPEEQAHRQALMKQYGKGSPEAARYMPKTPAENLMGRAGVHAWVAHQTEQASQHVGVHPSELQAADWFQTKFEHNEPAPPEVKPLFERPAKIKADSIGIHQQLPMGKDVPNLSGSADKPLRRGKPMTTPSRSEQDPSSVLFHDRRGSG